MKKQLMTKHYQRISRFMEMAGQDVPKEPGIPNAEVRQLRARLIFEEALETISALGCAVCISSIDGFETRELNENNTVVRSKSEYMGTGGRTVDIGEVIDGCCDISVVTMGTLIAFGVPDKPFLREVDRANLDKFGPGGYKRDDGKWVKPPDHQPPNILGVLDSLVDGSYPKKKKR